MIICILGASGGIGFSFLKYYSQIDDDPNDIDVIFDIDWRKNLDI